MQLQQQVNDQKKKKIFQLNEEIRKKNLAKREKIKQNKNRQEMLGNLPRQNIAQKIKEPTIVHKKKRSTSANANKRHKSRGSTSRSDRADHGMDFLELRPKLKKKVISRKKVENRGLNLRTVEDKNQVPNTNKFRNHRKSIKEAKRPKTSLTINLPPDRPGSSLSTKHEPDPKYTKFHKEISSYIKRQSNQKFLKEIQELPPKNLKNSKKPHKGDKKVKHKTKIYQDRTFNGAVPAHISKGRKKTKPKGSKNSKTPRRRPKGGKLSMALNKTENSKPRPGTSTSFYPRNSSIGIAEDGRYSSLSAESIPPAPRSPLSRFKINPSPYKRKEQSLDHLISKINTQISELEHIHSQNLQKHLASLKPKKKFPKKRKSKARSHSPVEQVKISKISKISKIQKKPIQQNARNQIIKSFHKPIFKKSTTRNKKNFALEDRPLKVKTIQGKNLKVKNLKGKKKKKKVVDKGYIEEVKRKVEDLERARAELEQKAATVIQRWYRRVKQRRMESIKVPVNKRNYGKDNKDISSLQSNPEVIEKRVIIDIQTNQK